MQFGTTISTVGHVALLAWGLATFGARPFDAMQVESMPIDIISATEFSQITSGIKTAPPVETPKPLVERVGDAKPVEDVAAKISDKPEIKSASAEAAPPPPPEAAPKPAEAKKAEQPPDQIAEALKAAEAKKEPPKPKPEPPKKPPQPKLDISKIENKLALLDKREQRRNASIGETLSNTPALGSATGRSSVLSINYKNALASKLQSCWQADGGSLRDEVRAIPITLSFNVDGTLAGPPRVDSPPRDSREQAIIEGVVRAVIKCQPFTMLPKSLYEEWKVFPMNFCPITEGDGKCSS